MRLTPAEALNSALGFLTDDTYDGHLGVAVSGGSDSLALLVLAYDWGRRTGFMISAVTVDHGLRTEARHEIAHVAAVCADLGVPHHVLPWTDWDGSGNLQAAARDARLSLLEQWQTDTGAAFVLLGHTADDQAETVLMRLARGSGVDGLAAIHDGRDGFLRPLLEIGRSELRQLLTARGIDWCDDPSNENDAFDRVKARKMMVHLAQLGLTRDRLVQTAKHMQSARLSLIQATVDFAHAHVRQEAGDLLIPKHVFRDIKGDTQARSIAAALMWIGRHDYRPRYSALCEMSQALACDQIRTLHGVHLSSEGESVRMTREFNALVVGTAPLTSVFQNTKDQTWDGRWSVVAKAPVRSKLLPPNASQSCGPLTIRALGDSIRDVPNWRDIGLPRTSLMATPAIFDGDTLVSAPVAGLQNGFEARIVSDFMSFLLSR